MNETVEKRRKGEHLGFEILRQLNGFFEDGIVFDGEAMFSDTMSFKEAVAEYLKLVNRRYEQ